MNEMQFTIEISATKEKVWNVLWQDATLREWAGLIDPGTYMVGELTRGSEVEFISAKNGYGVTSLVEKVIPNEYALLRHSADTKEHGTETRDKEWTGGVESYELTENNGVTILKVAFDVPEELVEYFTNAYPKALDKIKELAEK
jgi:uncharacterized protein YndB with AHSA1/START domain